MSDPTTLPLIQLTGSFVLAYNHIFNIPHAKFFLNILLYQPHLRTLRFNDLGKTLFGRVQKTCCKC